MHVGWLRRCVLLLQCCDVSSNPQRSVALQLHVLPSELWVLGGDWKSWMVLSAPATPNYLKAPNHEGQLVTQHGRVQAISPKCFQIPFGAGHKPFPTRYLNWTSSAVPRFRSWPSLHCSPSAELTWDERRQMTGYRVLRAGSGGFFCRHLAGCFKVFCL